MTEVALAVLVFSGVVMLLVGLVLAARRLLLPEGDVELVVNDATLRGRLGERLLEALDRAGIVLPSPCGGKGTCGQCTVTLLRGGGEALATERSRLTLGEVARGMRLACQVTIREPLAVRIPDEIFGVRQWRGVVSSSRCVGTLMKEIVLTPPPGEPLLHRAGAYVQVTCPPYRRRFADLPLDPAVRAEWERLGLLALEAGTDQPTKRAYSMANHPGEGAVILVVRIATPPPSAPEGTPPGIVSSYLFGLEPGEDVALTGPFGHFFASEGETELVFVGGGAGMAPMRAHLFDQLVRLGAKRKISFWYGARSARELFYVEEFDRLAAEHPNFTWTAALSEPRPEDGWTGEVGFIHDVLHRCHLAEHPEPEVCEFYLCGPPMMIRATRSLLDNLGVPPENVHFDDFGG